MVVVNLLNLDGTLEKAISIPDLYVLPQVLLIDNNSFYFRAADDVIFDPPIKYKRVMGMKLNDPSG